MRPRKRGDERAALAAERRERAAVLAGAHLQRDVHVPFVRDRDVSDHAVEVLTVALKRVGIADVERVAPGAGDGDDWHGRDRLTRLGRMPNASPPTAARLVSVACGK